ncbi:MAG: hypothetical protein JSU72_03235 [Deltaproteobacteria bacterium]|nr:MAG: hypothetical protein JSU72_03235 [Deltaproteobacteria bacterium]
MREVKRGFYKFKEVDTVYFDPENITVKEMEKILTQAGTYLDTVGGK